jgi:hypothetical protein
MRSRIACAPGAPDAGVAELHRGGREDVSRETARRRGRSREWSQSCGSMHSYRISSLWIPVLMTSLRIRGRKMTWAFRVLRKIFLERSAVFFL